MEYFNSTSILGKISNIVSLIKIVEFIAGFINCIIKRIRKMICKTEKKGIIMFHQDMLSFDVKNLWIYNNSKRQSFNFDLFINDMSNNYIELKLIEFQIYYLNSEKLKFKENLEVKPALTNTLGHKRYKYPIEKSLNPAEINNFDDEILINCCDDIFITKYSVDVIMNISLSYQNESKNINNYKIEDKYIRVQN